MIASDVERVVLLTEDALECMGSGVGGWISCCNHDNVQLRPDCVAAFRCTLECKSMYHLAFPIVVYDLLECWRNVVGDVG